ncbi:hypothetical protein SACC_12480 [Saccharolobus caldissimus]|uniref:Uncharacterized protein n=1 Tax=Saccharolobus caldissimus TaxID=1702097 RepID=A0AAQ4CR00_9CREN|nr:hypothetical protein SACC_12480 [Saccharolobus caldissimus]
MIILLMVGKNLSEEERRKEEIRKLLILIAMARM